MFRKYFSLNKGLALYYKQIRIPFQYEYYVPSLVKIGPVVFKKKLKMFVVYRWTDRRTNTDGQTNGRTTDNGWSETFSSGELKTKGANKNKKREKWMCQIQKGNWWDDLQGVCEIMSSS